MNPVARRILLTPGPATTSEAVKRALVCPDESPREAPFAGTVASVREKLCRVAQANPLEFSAALLAGPGTAAIEAALGTLVPRAGRLLVLDNGAYGERAAQIALRLGIAAEVWRLPPTVRPEAGAWRERLDAGRFTHAFWVHHETTTGMLNPLGEFAAACRERGVCAIVDAMSSFGGIDVDWGATGVGAVVSSASKCLQGLPGVSFVIVRRAALAAGEPRSLALDLRLHAETQDRLGQFPFTAPVQVLRAFECALEETLAESVPVRAARYRANYERLTAGLEARGITPLLPLEWRSRLLTAYLEPDWPGFSYGSLHDFLCARGITIYPGKIPSLRSFRMGHIGAIDVKDQDAVLAAWDEFRAARPVAA